jgi:predicted tellurium resistance membrane protein TerC
MKKRLEILIPITLFSLANFALAQVDVGGLIENIINYVLNIVIVCAGIIIIIGGYLMITSAGDPEKFKKGQKTLIYGAIGFILVFTAKELAEWLINLMK